MNAHTIRAIISKNKFELFIENWSYSYDQYRVFDTYQRMRANIPPWAGTRPRDKVESVIGDDLSFFQRKLKIPLIHYYYPR